MGTECFTPVRGSALRITGLDERGRVPDDIPYAVSKSVIRVSVREVTESGATDIFKTPEDERRLRIIRPAQTIRNEVDVEFLRVDPGVLSMVSGAISVGMSSSFGFGEGPFGEDSFGGEMGGSGDIVGFDVDTHTAPASFALEVWSKLAGSACVDGQRWGYTLFPFLKGGRISGFQFSNGLVSFNLIGAQTRKHPRWNVGPHDIDGVFQRLLTPVSRNSVYRMFVTEGAPPVEACGIAYRTDVLDNGTAANPMPDPSAPLAVDGGGAETSPYIIYGGRA